MTTKTDKAETGGLSKAQTDELNGLPTKSAKIRYLTALDWTRSQIADELQIRYQHVRNVQITPVATPKS